MTTTTFASALTARDFSSSTVDPGRDRWTLGKMRHVVAAAEGKDVVIVAEASTGFTLAGVRLTGVVYRLRGDFAGQGRVLVTTTLSNGETQTTGYRLEDIGAVIIMGGSKYDALSTYRAEVSAGIRAAQALHGEPEGRNWGSWSGEAVGGDGSFPAAVDVTYTPHTGNPAAAEYAGGHGERGWWRISAAEMASV